MIYGPKSDGTYIIEFRMADGESLAISVPVGETRVLKHFQAWPAPGSEDTELGVLMELEVGHGETEVYARVQA
jgi:hypothetical protein